MFGFQGVFDHHVKAGHDLVIIQITTEFLVSHPYLIVVVSLPITSFYFIRE